MMRTIVLSGTPYQMGKQHGSAFAKEIRDFAASRLNLLKGYLPTWSLNEIYDLAREQIDVLQEYREEFEEFCGIADGADITQEDLMVLNNYTDMRNFSKTDEGCSTVYYNDNGQIVLGQTWDMSADAAPFILHLHIKGSPELHIFTVVGCLALCGVGSHGVGVFINDLKTHETSRGLMWPALVRRLILQKSAKDGVEYISKNLPASAHHYLICDANEGYSVETTGKRIDVVNSVKGKGYAFHTNHYLGSLGTTEADIALGSTTHERQKKLEEFFKQNKNLDFSKIAKGLFGSPTSAGGVCLFGNTGAITCGGMLYDLKLRQGEVFATNYSPSNADSFKF